MGVIPLQPYLRPAASANMTTAVMTTMDPKTDVTMMVIPMMTRTLPRIGPIVPSNATHPLAVRTMVRAKSNPLS